MCVLFGLFFNIFCLVYVCLFCSMSHSGRPVWKWARAIVADNGLCGWQVLFRVVVIRDSSFVLLIQSRKRFLFRLIESLFFWSAGGFFSFGLRKCRAQYAASCFALKSVSLCPDMSLISSDKQPDSFWIMCEKSLFLWIVIVIKNAYAHDKKSLRSW